eukprot:9386661-Ditylum_brightwellii.AAC.1
MQAKIQKLVNRGQEDKLKAISQHYLENAWYKVAFHESNSMGIHGACPSKILHALLLGLFKYLQETFFKHMGENSQLADDINAIAKNYGKWFTRQSDRRFPKTNFSKGIWKGKLMGVEHCGVMLNMAA